MLAADILVLAGPIWLGDNSSVMKKVIERLYACSHLLNQAGQYACWGRSRRLPDHRQRRRHQALRHEHPVQPPHLATPSRPRPTPGWIGEAGPGPSYLDPGSGGPGNDFTNRNTTFMTWNLMHLARMLKDAGSMPPATATSDPNGTPDAVSTSKTPTTADQRVPADTQVSAGRTVPSLGVRGRCRHGWQGRYREH